MTVHFVVLFSICFLAIHYFGKNKSERVNERNRKLFIILSMLILFLVIALRAYVVGLDTRTYHFYYERMSTRSASYVDLLSWEPLYLLFCRIGIWIGSFQVVTILCAVVTCGGFGYFLWSTAKERWEAFWYLYFFITLNLYFNSMHLMRQICAMALVINVYPVLRKDNGPKGWIKTAILVALGTGFHITAPIFALPIIFPLVLKKVDRKTICFAVIMGIIGCLLITYGEQWIIATVDRFSKYQGDDRLETSNMGIYSWVLIGVKLFLLYVALKLDPKKPENKEIYQLTFIHIAATAFYVLQSRTQFALRIGYWYEMYFPLYIYKVVNRVSPKKSRKLLLLLFFLFGLAYFFYMMQFGGNKSNRRTVPYYFFWEDFPTAFFIS